MKFSYYCQKNSYTKNELGRVLDDIYNKRKVKLRSYFCNQCNSYHLTKEIDKKYIDFL